MTMYSRPPYLNQNGGYYPLYGQPIPSTQPQQQAQQGLLWVQGEGAAKSYPVAPGNTVALFDSESYCLYIKSCDQSGMPSMRILDYTERVQTPKMPVQGETHYVSRDEFDKLVAQVEKMKGDNEHANSDV